MITGNFYYLKASYYEKFPNCNLIGNKADSGDERHDRPCFYCFEKDGIYWMIPISSQIEKYENLYNEKMQRYNGQFDGIRFGYVNGKKRAFLIQNMCPATDDYVDHEYRIEKNTKPVRIDEKLAKELNAIARKVLRFYYDRGIKIVLTDLDIILQSLLSEKEC